ncbi:MAG TPA: response regulator [bacterium]|nr:response regulator [bacterium]
METKKTILIIEDNPSSIYYLRRVLEKEGYRTLVAEGGFSGFEMARTEKPDLILLDIMLPDMDGHKVCRMIKMNRALQHIPVAMFTSRDTDEDAEKAKEGGADAFILKSTRIEILVNILQRLLEKNTDSHQSRDG